MLIIFGGLPGTGKTTLARRLARSLHARHLRVDSIEQALRDAWPAARPIGPAGYLVAYALDGTTCNWDYAAWDRDRVVIETAHQSVGQALAKLGNTLSAIRSG